MLSVTMPGYTSRRHGLVMALRATIALPCDRFGACSFAPARVRVQENWRQYVAAENSRMVGHLMTYPFAMPECGVHYDPEVDEVPDFPGASFAGGNCMLPDVLTT
jgi:hypothetical protein